MLFSSTFCSEWRLIKTFIISRTRTEIEFRKDAPIGSRIARSSGDTRPVGLGDKVLSSTMSCLRQIEKFEESAVPFRRRHDTA